MTDPHASTPRPRSEAELVELIHSIDVPAPESLQRKVDAMVAAHSSPARRRRRGADSHFSLAPRIAALGAIAGAVIVLAIAVGLSGSSSTLSVRDAAVLTHRSATHGPPPERAGQRRELAAAVDGVWFPYWGGRLGWHASGSRVDSVDGRDVKTVFYENGHGRRIGYAIVAGSAPSLGSGGVVSRRDGTPYRVLTIDGAPVVTWVRDGHMCVVSGHGVSGATLLRLASWDERATTA